MKKFPFFFLFNSIILILVVIYISDYFFLRKLVADHVSWLLSVWGLTLESNVIGNLVFVGTNYEINTVCIGIEAVAVFIGIIFSSVRNFFKQLFTFLILILVLYPLNILRISFAIFLNNKGISWLISHTIIGRSLALVFGVLAFLFVFRMLPNILDNLNLIIDYVKSFPKSLYRYKAKK